MLSIGIVVTVVAGIVGLVIVAAGRPRVDDLGSLSERWIAANRLDSE